MTGKRPISLRSVFGGLAMIAVFLASCTAGSVLNIAAPAGVFVAGSVEPVPSAIQVGFINNTPHRAIFTYGAYDQFDQETIPTGFGQLRLEGNTASAQVAQPCRKTFSVGGDELVRLLNENERDPNIDITDPRALVRGVYFSSAPLGDPLEAEPTEGTAEGLVLLNGVDFDCRRDNIHDTSGSGLLLFTFVQDAAAPGGFRIDYMFVSP
ncbi:MAG: hypothetical protein ABII12_04570 [Planctomycetota bacterium]